MRLATRRSALSGTFASAHTMGTGLVIAALAFTMAALLLPVKLFENAALAGPNGVVINDDGEGVWNTQYGPLTPIDRDFVRKVRGAGLWEGPAGRQAIERATTDAVRIAGEHLIEGHTELDEMSIEVGRELGIVLPNQPNKQQQQALATLERAQVGIDFERKFANILRKAHGQVFGLIGQVRAQTTNSLVRDLATRANAVVLDHITVLEATGLVDYEELFDDVPSNPARAVAPLASRSTRRQGSTTA